VICINLLDLFSDRYRITFDLAYSARHVHRAKLDPWMMEIPCQGRGVMIYLHGGDTLAVEVDRRPSIVAKLKAIEGLNLHQDGDLEKTFLFDVALFEQVAEVVKPRKRRRLTPTQLRALAQTCLQLPRWRSKIEARTSTGDFTRLFGRRGAGRQRFFERAPQTPQRTSEQIARRSHILTKETSLPHRSLEF
jgi:hypothetical protein